MFHHFNMIFDGLGIIFGYISVIIGVMCVLFSLIAVIRQLNSHSWRLIQAKIIQSEVDVTEGRKGTSYSHQLNVEYEVAGIRYTYKPLLKTCYAKESKVRKLCEKFPVSATIWARVNHKNPMRIILEGYETPWTYLPIIIIGISFMVIPFVVGLLNSGTLIRALRALF